jgi:uncharacterized membrane protein YecN with MAPEG domain
MHPLVALVTLLSLLVYLWMGLRVGGARSKFGVEAPATSGSPEFERYFRVHYNTLEWLVIYLPSLWLFAIYVNDLIAAGVGLVWIVGRILYALGYVKEAGRRSLGFLIQMLATAVLLFGSLGYIVWGLVQHGV